MAIPDSEPSLEQYREKLSIWAGLLALGTLLVGGDSGDPNIEAFLLKNKKFVLPPPVCDKGTYAENWALRLHLAYKRPGDKGVLALQLSNELFLLENHNRMLSLLSP
jgi:hypothetical protein